MGLPRNKASRLQVIGFTLFIFLLGGSTGAYAGNSLWINSDVIVEGILSGSQIIDGHRIGSIAVTSVLKAGVNEETIYEKGLAPLGSLQVNDPGVEEDIEYLLFLEETDEQVYNILNSEKVEHPEYSFDPGSTGLFLMILLSIVLTREWKD